MAIDRPEKMGSRHFDRSDGPTLSMPAFVEVAQLVLGAGRTIRVRALGKSMTPFIKDRGEVTLAPVLVEKHVGLGDVVAYLHRTPSGQRFVVHRVVGRRNSSYLIRADHGKGYDTLSVRPGDIIGRNRGDTTGDSCRAGGRLTADSLQPTAHGLRLRGRAGDGPHVSAESS